MFVPMWVVWVAVALVLAPIALFVLFLVYVRVVVALHPPKPGNEVLDPLGEDLARGTWMHKHFKAPAEAHSGDRRGSGT